MTKFTLDDIDFEGEIAEKVVQMMNLIHELSDDDGKLQEVDNLDNYIDQAVGVKMIRCNGQTDDGEICNNQLMVPFAQYSTRDNDALKASLKMAGWNEDFIWYEYGWCFSECFLHIDGKNPND
jgi:hypothetical protein